jgi:hypothetical protein
MRLLRPARSGIATAIMSQTGSWCPDFIGVLYNGAVFTQSCAHGFHSAELFRGALR